MGENDMIAEYAKKKYPEILKTLDFTFYKLGRALGNCIKQLGEPMVRAYTEYAKAMTECEKMETELSNTWKQQTMSRFERVE